jgi:hypothetical protein
VADDTGGNQRQGGTRARPSGRRTTAAELQALRDQVQALEENLARGQRQIWTAMENVTGFNELASGLADVVEVLGPLRQLAPPTTAVPLQPGVGAAIARIFDALAVDGRARPKPDSLPMPEYADPVPYIGQPNPDDEPAYYEEQLA